MRPQPLIAAALVVPALAAACAFVMPSYWLTLVTYSGMAALVCIGLVMMTGYAGITSFGQAAFAGLGAYTTAMITTRLGGSPWLGLVGGIALTIVAATVIGWITVRLSGHYLVIGTFAWSISLFYVFANIEMLGGYNGLGGVPALFDGSRVAFNALVWLIVALALIGAMRVLDSRAGRAMRAAPSKAMAEAFGIDTARAKLNVFILGAVLAAVAGWLQAHYLHFVNPGPFHLNASVEYLFMTIIGGVGHLLGALAGALIFTVTKSLLQTIVPAAFGATANHETVVFGLLVLVLLHRAPRGIMSLLPARFNLKPRRRSDASQGLPRRQRAATGRVVMSVEDVSKQFQGVQALKGVGFALRAGEIVALVGPNGAGKSTLFNVMTGLAAGMTGRIRLLDETVTALKARQLSSRGIARTFQHAHLRQEMTVLENVAIGAHARGRGGVIRALLGIDTAEEHRILAEARACLERLGMADVANVPAGTLPLGKQRLVEVARALASDPVVILLDEPAAGLRYHEKQDLAAAIRAMRDLGMAVLVVEHDLDFVTDVASRVIVLDFGIKITEGTPAEIVRDPRVIEAYLGQR